MARPFAIKWPNKAKVALTFTVALELYSEGGARIAPNTKDYFALDLLEYGGKRGAWRIMDIFARAGASSTVLVSGRAAEVYPEAVSEFHRSGHEIAGHSYAQDILEFLEWPQFAIKSEKENIQRCVSALKKVTGEPPYGWLSPGATPSPDTFRLLAEEGFLWCSDAYDDDTPHLFENNGKRLVIIPYQSEINDYNLWLANTNSPKVYEEEFKQTLDFLRREGADEPKLMNATVHCHMYARAYAAYAVENALRYAKRFPDVWIATRKDIATWYLRHYG